MKGIRVLGACLAAACVLGLVGAASAFAEAPEFQTQNKKTGVWEPLAKKVAYTETTGTVSIAGAGSDLVCTASTGKGKLTGPKTFTVKTVFTGCHDTHAGVTCQSGKKAGVIKTAMLEGTLVSAGAAFAGPTVPALSTPGFGSYTCASAKLVMTGSVLGAATPTNESTEELRDTYGEGPEPEPGCGNQELQLINGFGPCVHLAVQNSGAGTEEPVTMVAVKEKRNKGHITLLK
jgi:hypothetical protein